MRRRSMLVAVVLTLVLLNMSACSGTDTGSSTSTAATGATTPATVASASPSLAPTPTLTSTPIQVTGISISMNPSNFSTFVCGTSTAIVLAAQITVSGGSGGQVHYTWNINHVATTANITFAPGQTSQAVNDTINNVVVQLNSASLVSVSISAVSSSGSPVTASVVPTGVCHLPGPFEVVSIAMSVNPASVNGILCGTVVNITYIATVTIAADSNAGTVTLVWNAVYTHTVVTLFFAPAQTVGTVTLTVPQKAEHHSAFPRPVSIASTSPNAYNSVSVQPVGQCT